MRRSDIAALTLALALLLSATLPWIHHLGLEYDEAHFLPLAQKIASGAEERLDLPWGYTIAHRPIPFVTMPYVGTLDSLLYAIPYRLFGSGALTARLTNIAFAFAIFLLAYWIAHREAGPSAAALTLGLLLVDIELILHIPTGFGPFLLQQLLGLAAIAALQQWWRTGGAGLFFLATALLALAFHEKLTFIWVLGSLIPAVLLFRAKLTWQQARWWYFPAAFLLALLIVSPILYFAWAVPEIILGFGKQSAKAPADWSKLLADRWHVFDLMLRGHWTIDFTAGPPPQDLKRGPALLILFFSGLAATLWTRQRLALILYTTSIGVWVWNLPFPDAGRMHHLLLMAPLWQLAAAISLFTLALPFRVATLLLLLWSSYDATNFYRQYNTQVRQTGGINHWSDMTTKAQQFFDANPKLEAVTTSWGLGRTMTILSNGRLQLVEHYFDTLTEPFTPEATQLITELIHKDRQVWLVSDVMPIYEEQWQRVIRLANKQPVKIASFASRDGRNHIAAYRFDTPQPQPTRAIPQTTNEFDLIRDWQSLRFTLQGLAESDTESLNIHWLDANGQTCWIDSRPLGWIPHIKPSSTFEFSLHYWPASFRRQRLSATTPTRVRLEISLKQAQILNTELTLP